MTERVKRRMQFLTPNCDRARQEKGAISDIISCQTRHEKGATSDHDSVKRRVQFEKRPEV